jgi:hypothetical protein
MGLCDEDARRVRGLLVLCHRYNNPVGDRLDHSSLVGHVFLNVSVAVSVAMAVGGCDFSDDGSSRRQETDASRAHLDD